MRAIEYGLIAALITVATIGLLTAMGGTYDGIFQAVVNFLGEADMYPRLKIMQGKLAALQADFDGLIRHVEELTGELADARSRNMDLSSRNADLVEVCEDLRHRMEAN